MKSWWIRLTQREQTLLMLGTLLCLFVVFYSLFWRPLAIAVDQIAQKNQAQWHLLFLMKRTQSIMRRLQLRGVKVSLGNKEALLSLVETTLAQNQLSQYMESIHQSESKSIEIKLKNVPFDKLIKSVEFLWNRYAVAVVSMRVKRGAIAGVVANITLVLHQE